MADLLQELDSYGGAGQQVSDKHVEDISLSSCKKWRFLPPYLDLPLILVENIDSNPRAVTESDKRCKFFQAWKAAKGSEATYRELTRALLAIGCRQDAECVYHLLASAAGSPSSDTSLRSRPSARAGIRVRPGRDVNFLLENLNTHSHKWEAIGTALNFLPGELANIKFSPQANTLQQHLRELLSRWAQWPTPDHPEEPTMEKLQDALRSRLVGLGALAREVYESKYWLSSRQISSRANADRDDLPPRRVEADAVENVEEGLSPPPSHAVSPPTHLGPQEHQTNHRILLKRFLFIIFVGMVIYGGINLIPPMADYSLAFGCTMLISLFIVIILAGFCLLKEPH